MSEQDSARRRHRAALRRHFALVLLLAAGPARAAVVVSPPAVTVNAGDSSALVTVNLSYPAPVFTGLAELILSGLPAGVSPVPSPVTFMVMTGVTTATVTFNLATTPATPAGSYPIPITTAPDLGAGTGSLLLIVQAPSFDSAVAPNPLTLSPGETRTATVTTFASGGFTETITYSFSGLPAGIDWGAPRSVAPPYPPQAFTFTAAPGTAPGTYGGALVATWVALGAQTKTFPLTVIVRAPELRASFSPSAIQLCDGGAPAGSNLLLDPGSSYAGTPTLTWLAVPPGLEVSPATPTTPPLPPARSILVSVRAAGAAPGLRHLVLRAADPAAGVDTTATLTAEVVAGDFLPTAAPVALTLSPGGAAQSLQASIAAQECFTSPTVTITPIGLPHGVTFTPAVATLAAPGYAAATFAARANASARVGSHSVTLLYTPTTGAAKSVEVVLTLSLAGDATLTLSPREVTVAAGASASVMLSATGANGFGGTLTVAAPVLPFLTFTPATFTLRAGESRAVEIRARKDAPPGSTTGRFTATAPELAGARTAELALTVAAAPDFDLSVAPAAATLRPGEETSVRVSVTGSGGFAGNVAVTAPAIAGVAFTPPAFTLTAGSSREVRLRAAPGTPAASHDATFVATAAGLATPRRATLALTVAVAPPEITSASPPVLAAGTSGVLVRLTGLRFQPGATVTLVPPGPVVTSTRVLSPTLAEIVVATAAAVATGSYRIDLRNPDGGRAERNTAVVVCPPSSLAAPLAVTTAAIVFPRPYAAMADGARLHPRAVLATTGLGTLVGTWRLDGIPFDQFVVTASGGLPVEVTSNLPIPLAFLGEHRLELVVEHPQRLATEPVPVIVSVESLSGLEILAPEEGAVVGDPAPLVRWTLVPGASGYEIEIAARERARSRRVRLSASQWRPDAETLAELGPGRHRYRVAAVFPGEVLGEPTAWRSLVVPAEGAAAAPDSAANDTRARYRTADLRLDRAATGWTLAVDAKGSDGGENAEEAPATAERHADWEAALVGSATDTEEDGQVGGDAGRIQLSARSDLLAATFQLKGTGDVGARKDLDPRYETASESRNWQLESALLQPGWREEARVGYSPPEFLDQSEFLAAGLARGGALGKITTPAGAFSYYDTFHDGAAGAVSGLVGLDQNLTGAGWEAPLDASRALVRVFGLRARGGDPWSTGASTEAEAIGVLSRWTFGPGLTLLFEGARGTLSSAADAPGDDLEGYGFHLGASGVLGTLNYAFNLRQVDAELVNPANLGLTAGAVPDRFGGDLMMGKTIGRSTLSLELRRLESGSLPDGTGAKVVEDGAGLNLFSPLGDRVQLVLGTNLTRTRSDGDPRHQLPGADRSLLGLNATLSESVGGFALSQSLTWQDLADDANPAFDQTVSGFALSASGNVSDALALTALLSGTRTEAAPPFGSTDLWLASLQPVVRWSRARLTFTPLVSFTRYGSELSGTIDTEQYQLIVDWAPGWWRSFATLQIAADWSRSAVDGQENPGFHQRIVAGLALRWGLSRAQLRSTPLPPPLPTAARDPRGLAARTVWLSRTRTERST